MTNAQPANDNACNAINLSVGFNSPFTNVNATIQIGEPAIPTGTCTAQGNWCAGEPTPQVRSSVWFKFTVPTTGTGSYAFRVNGNTGTFDSQAALFFASTCADLTNGNAIRLAANDDSASSLFNSYMTVFCLTPSLTYYLMVDGYGATTFASFFVDVIELPDRNAVANAGSDQTICYSLFPTIPVSGSVLGIAGSTTWTSTGNGTFADAAALNTSYTPGNADKTAGQIQLILSTNDPAGICIASRDTMVLTIIADSVSAGNDKTFCSGQQYIKMNGAANLFTSLIWSTVGDGVFNNANTLNADYFPGPNDLAAASFKLVLRGVSTQCFNTVYDTVEVFNVTGTVPVINLGPDYAVCLADSILINPLSLTNYNTLNWITNGDGHFNNSSTSSVYYTPGFNDLANGNVMLRLIATGIAPCQGIVEDTLVLSIKQAVRINGFTSGNTFCSSDNIVLGVNAQLYSSLQWITSGDGNFSSANSPGTIYIPGSNDFAAGVVNISINAAPVSPCLSDASDAMQLFVTLAPSISLKIPDSSSSNTTISISATVSGYQTTTWSSSGNGIFEDRFSTKTKYAPGTADIANGSITFTLIVLGNSPCNAYNANAVTVIIPNPVINAGPDQPVCLFNNVNVNAIATNYSAIAWSTDGDGVFVDSSAANTIYLPGPGDFNDGIVSLFVLAEGITPCTSVATDALTVTFITPATADAGINVDIVAGQQVILDGFTANALQHHWITAGDGTFNDSSLLNAIYTPGPTDISNGTVTLGLVAVSLPPCISSTTDFFVVNIFPDALLAVKLFFEGFYSNGMMIPSLNNSGLSTNTALSDYYVFQLHDTIAPYAAVFTDSVVVYTSGLSFISLPAFTAGKSYFISIRHRNSLETWSRIPYEISSFGLYDFTVGGSQVYDRGQNRD